MKIIKSADKMIRKIGFALSISVMLGGCSTLDLPFSANRDEKQNAQSLALADQQAKTQRLTVLVSELRQQNSKLIETVAKLEREKQREANKAEISSQLAAEETAAREARAAIQAKNVLTIPPPPKNPDTLIVAEAEAQPLASSSITVESTPRLIEPSFVAAETVFENEATGANLETTSLLYGVHLASYRKKDEAILGWKTLQRENPNLLGLLEPRLEMVQVEGRGEFQRLIAGGFSSEDKANDLCSDMKRKKLYCMVTPFNGQRLAIPAAG